MWVHKICCIEVPITKDCSTTFKIIFLMLCESEDEELDGVYNVQSFAHSI
jgi:hypothetical protein